MARSLYQRRIIYCSILVFYNTHLQHLSVCCTGPSEARRGYNCENGGFTSSKYDVIYWFLLLSSSPSAMRDSFLPSRYRAWQFLTRFRACTSHFLLFHPITVLLELGVQLPHSAVGLPVILEGRSTTSY